MTQIICGKIDLTQISFAYARLIFEKAIMTRMPLDEFQLEIDMAADEARVFLASDDPVEEDVALAVMIIRSTIFDEFVRLLTLVPEDKPERLQ